MNLPDVQRGMAILAEHVQRLNAAIRQVRMRPGVGYFVKETSGGTSLVIDQGLLGGAGTTKCWFKLTNATEGSTIKIEIQQDQIAGRYPQGMGLGFPPYKITITGNRYFYISVKYNTTTLEIDTASDAIQIVDSDSLKTSTTDKVYVLIGTVTVEAGTVKTIDNICDRPIPNPCNLAWESPS